MNHILGRSVMFFIICCSVVYFGCEKRVDNSRSEKQSDAGKAERYEKKYGPFNIGKKRIFVINVIEQEENANMVNSFEMKDESGLSLYKEKYKYDPTVEGIDIEGVFKLEGKSGVGIIVFFDREPNAPPAGKSFQVFGMKNGKLKPLSAPIEVYGRIEQLPDGKSKGSLKLLPSDIVRIGEWKGLVGITIPLVVDFQKFTITPQKTNGILEIYFATNPEQPRTASRTDINFYEDHNVKAQVNTITSASLEKVEFIKAYADVELKKQWNALTIDVSNLWLNVNINGLEGWVTGANDFFALGLVPVD